MVRTPYDPRVYQIAVLASMMIYGVFWLNLEIFLSQVIVIIFSVLVTQYALLRLVKLPVFDVRSPLISGLSLCLLLRTNSMFLAISASVITIASKFCIRFRGKHLFNPTNFGLVAMMFATNDVWVSPGQWGSAAYFGFLVACIGGLVVNRATRSDVTFAFLGIYIALTVCRALWLGDPLTIPFHQIQNGAFLIFTFFMISDPKTTPDSRFGRILFAFLVASGALFVQFVLYRHNGLLWSLATFSVLTPVIDRLFPGPTYVWNQAKQTNKPTTKPGVEYEKTTRTDGSVPVHGTSY